MPRPWGPQLPSQIVVGQPSIELSSYRTVDRAEIVGPYYISYFPTLNLPEKTVTFLSQAQPVPPGEGGYVGTEKHYESVGFWPTTAAILDNETVAVAGKGGDIDQVMTTIEVWKMTTPFVTFRIDPLTGLQEPTIANLQVRSRTVVYNDAVVGRDIVRALIRVRGKPSSMFVQFHDSNDLYELDYTQAVAPTSPPPVPRFPLTKLFRGTPGTDVPFVPELADRSRNWVSGATHNTQGVRYCWWVSLDDQITNSNYVKTLEASDWDKNGTIDAWSVPTAEQNQAAGLLDISQHTEVRLATIYPRWQ